MKDRISQETAVLLLNALNACPWAVFGSGPGKTWFDTYAKPAIAQADRELQRDKYLLQLSVAKKIAEKQQRGYNDSGDCGTFIHFDFKGTCIINPFMDEDNRREVDPLAYYGEAFLNSDFMQIPNGPHANDVTLIALCVELEHYQTEHGLKHQSADEQLAECDNEKHRAYLKDYCRRWDEASRTAKYNS